MRYVDADAALSERIHFLNQPKWSHLCNQRIYPLFLPQPETDSRTRGLTQQVPQ